MFVCSWIQRDKTSHVTGTTASSLASMRIVRVACPLMEVAHFYPTLFPTYTTRYQEAQSATKLWNKLASVKSPITPITLNRSNNFMIRPAGMVLKLIFVRHWFAPNGLLQSIRCASDCCRQQCNQSVVYNRVSRCKRDVPTSEDGCPNLPHCTHFFASELQAGGDESVVITKSD